MTSCTVPSRVTFVPTFPSMSLKYIEPSEILNNKQMTKARSKALTTRNYLVAYYLHDVDLSLAPHLVGSTSRHRFPTSNAFRADCFASHWLTSIVTV